MFGESEKLTLVSGDQAYTQAMVSGLLGGGKRFHDHNNHTEEVII